MITKRIFSFLIVVLLGDVMAKGQFTVNQSSTQNADCTFSLNGLPSLNQTHPHSHLPFYWDFWIFGNGEYYPEIKRTWPTPPPQKPNVKFCWENYTFPGFASPWNTSVNYKYPTPYGLAFDPIVISLPRKGDNPPPDAFMVRPLSPGTVTPTTPSALPSFTPTPRIQSIPAGKYIHLAHSHGYLASHIYPVPNPNVHLIGEKSVFVISYKPKCMDGGITGKVYLYFGAKRAGANGILAKSPHLAWSEHRNPKYYATQNGDSHNFTPVGLSLFSSGLGFEFNDNFVQTGRSAIGLMDASEFRLFEEVEFTDTDPDSLLLESGDWSFALAILTSNSPCVTPDAGIINFLKAKEITSGMGPNYQLAGTSDYIMGADTIYLKSGEPDDPNRLYVTNICTCPQGGFRVSFKLEYTNVSAMAANGATIHLNPIDPRFSFCKLIEARHDTTASFRWHPCSQMLNFNSGYRLWAGSTGTVRFDMIAQMSLQELQSILQKNHVVGGDVQFLNTLDIVDFKNELLLESDSLLFEENMNRPCSSCNCDPTPFCPPWWLYAIGIVVLASIVATVLYPKIFKS